MQWERLADGVCRCRLSFCDVTIGLVWGSRATLLIDTGSTLDEARTIEADVRDIAGSRVTHVVLTHQHFDHVLGSSVFAGSQMYCAPGVVDHLSSATDQLRADALRYGADTAEIDRAIGALQPPRHGVQEAVVDHGGRAASILHLGPGHTESDLVVVVRDGGRPAVVFTGDLVEESGDPSIDADSNLAAWPATLDRLLTVGGPDARYVPGHGRVVDATFVRRQRDWLQAQLADR